MFNKYFNYLLEPRAPTAEALTKVIVVKPGQPVVQIAKNLEEEKLIKSAFAFRLLVAQMGISKNIQAGDFRLSANMSSRQIAKELTHGAIDVWITLPEGLRKEEQAKRIEEKLKFGSNNVYQFDKNEYIKLAEEGYMFPDTYLIPKDATAKDVVKRLRETFNQKTADIISKKGSNNLTSEEVIILASLIEKEAKTDNEKPVIAGILLNRLKAGIALQVDATVSYAKGYDSAKNTWWPQVIINDYKIVKSPYNTYLFTGLPQAPISNPGLESIRAAVNPAETNYFYYLHDSNGKIHYATTVEEHNKNIRDFL